MSRLHVPDWASVAVVVLLVLAVAVPAAGQSSGYPRLANIYFPDLRYADLEVLAKWDLLVVPKRACDQCLDELETLRSLNPDIERIIHMPVGYHGEWLSPPINEDLVTAIYENDWWMKDVTGERVYLPSGAGVVNTSIWAPTNAEGEMFCEWVADYIHERISPDGPWEGVFLDYCMDDIHWVGNVHGSPLDADADGVADGKAELNAAWRAGMEILVSRLRELVGDEFTMITNGNNTLYADCNGSTREDFPEMHGDWYDNIKDPEWGYIAISTLYRDPIVSIVNVMWDGPVVDGELVRDDEFEREFAFNYTSTLIFGNGYYSFDGGEGLTEHSQTWWHELYDLELGEPRAGRERPEVSIVGVERWEMISRRRFENGVAVVNPTTVTETVGLGGTYFPRASFNGEFYPYAAATGSVDLTQWSGDVLVGCGQAFSWARNVHGTVNGSGDVELHWDPVDGASAYSVYRSHRPDGSSSPAALMAVVSEPGYVDTSAKPNRVYFYRVAPIDEWKCEAPLSGNVSIVTPPEGRSGESPGSESTSGASDMSDGVGGLLEDHRGACAVNVDGTAESFGVPAREAGESVGSMLSLHGSHPNPAGQATSISFDIRGSREVPGSTVTLTVYDIMGRVVRRLLDAVLPPGSHTVTWDTRSDSGERVASGCYLYVLTREEERRSGKVVVLGP